jgi:hypothetical protein
MTIECPRCGQERATEGPCDQCGAWALVDRRMGPRSTLCTGGCGRPRVIGPDFDIDKQGPKDVAKARCKHCTRAARRTSKRTARKKHPTPTLLKYAIRPGTPYESRIAFFYDALRISGADHLFDDSEEDDMHLGTVGPEPTRSNYRWRYRHRNRMYRTPLFRGGV